MDFGGLLVLGALWVLFNLIARSRSGPAGSGRQPSRPLPPARPPRSGDPTQREGSQLERLLRELERTLDQGQGRGPLGRQADAPLPEAEEVEDRETLEEPARVVSLEAPVHRPERPRARDEEEAAEELIRRRIAAAEARDGALTRADHLKFDQRIRREPADATAVRAYTPEELRQAVVWTEILGPPASLREPGPPGA